MNNSFELLKKPAPIANDDNSVLACKRGSDEYAFAITRFCRVSRLRRRVCVCACVRTAYAISPSLSVLLVLVVVLFSRAREQGPCALLPQ